MLLDSPDVIIVQVKPPGSRLSLIKNNICICIIILITFKPRHVNVAGVEHSRRPVGPVQQMPRRPCAHADEYNHISHATDAIGGYVGM